MHPSIQPSELGNASSDRLTLVLVNLPPDDKLPPRLAAPKYGVRKKRLLAFLKTVGAHAAFMTESSEGDKHGNDYWKMYWFGDNRPLQTQPRVLHKQDKAVTNLQNGTGWVDLDGRWLTGIVEGLSFLVVHAPLPARNRKGVFYDGIQKYLNEHKPNLLLGDFNWKWTNGQPGTPRDFEGYTRLVPNKIVPEGCPKKETYPGGRMHDQIHINTEWAKTLSLVDLVNRADVRTSDDRDSYISDHSILVLSLSKSPSLLSQRN